MSDLPLEASTMDVSPECIGTPQLANSPADPILVLHGAIANCDTFTEAAEKSLVNGSVVALRLAFKHAEEAFDQAQQCIGNLTTDELSVDVEQRMSDLGLRLDALWVQLVCVFP